MIPDDYLVISVTPDTLAKLDFSEAEDLLTLLTADDDTISQQAGKLFLDVESLLEADNREPGEIAELRVWTAELDRRYPYLPYFLSHATELAQLGLYANLLVPFHVDGNRLRFERQELERFALEKIRAIHDFCGEHGISPKDSIRHLCEQLNLDIIEEITEDDEGPRFPFESERITSPFLIDFFESGYYFHTIDASDEPVLFALVDDPVAAYYADTAVEIELFTSSAYPVIALELTVFDLPESPLKMTFVYNIDIERHRRELYQYAEMPYISANFLFKQENELFYGFTRAIALPDPVRERIRSLVLDASNLLRAIPKEARRFPDAVAELFAAKGHAKEAEAIEAEMDELPPLPEAPAAPEPDDHEEVKAAATAPQTGDDSLPEEVQTDEETPVDTDAEGDSRAARAVSDAADILQEIEVVNSTTAPEHVSDDDGQRHSVRSPYESAIPASVLPESIQRITKALSKPVRKPARNITEELSIAPAPKRVVMREEDPMERLSRRLVIMQNNLERTERENLRLSSELKAAREEIEHLQRENMSLETRWWKFWR